MINAVKRKITPFIIMLSLSIMVFCGSTMGLIYAMTSVTVTNRFETGIVDIKLTEYQKIGDEEELWSDNPTVMPADEISKIPRIHNDGNDCFVRAKVTFREITEINENNLFGISDKWVKADDGFYYYTDVLNHGEDVDIFQGLRIPHDLPQELERAKFYIDIDVDAIQSRNFAPQFDSASPWGSVEILECEKEGQYDISTFKQADTKSFRIEYQGDAGKFITNSDDFFANIPYLMPADKFSDTATIVNDGKDSIKLYFRSEALDDNELLDKILLKITTKIDGKDEIVYKGVLRAEDLKEDILLGVIPANAKGDFNFEIEVPSELNNKYTIEDSFVKWIFSTEPIVTKPVQTGDTTNIPLYVSLMGMSVVCIYILLVLRKREMERGEV